MGMEMKLNVKLAQKLVMTPQLQQAIKLLPLARLELAQLIRQEIIENPVLEELEGEQENDDLLPEAENDETEESDGLSADAAAGEEKAEADEEISEGEMFDLPKGTETPAPDPEPVPATTQEQEIDWDNYFQNNLDQGGSADNYAERPPIEATYKTAPSLSDHLFWQLGLAMESEAERDIGACIIGNIQPDGYLTANVEEIAAQCDAKPEDVEYVLDIIQGFEPTGVGARVLKECLVNQALARPRSKTRNLMVQLIEGFLDRLEERHYTRIASELKTTVQEIMCAIQGIRELDPKPGYQYSSAPADYVVPDLVVVKTSKGYDVALIDEGIPKVRISPIYYNLLQSSKEGEAKEYLENKYRSALWLIKSIDQRQQTILKVGKSIVKQQTEFLDNGLSYLKPMVLRDVAADIEMHESTVSRITTNKYIDTPQGVFELKFFFHSGIKSYIGNDMSSIRVKNMLKEAIAGEDPKNPYTDDALVEILMRKNAKIARRTITKYRKELNIPPANKRKKIF